MQAGSANIRADIGNPDEDDLVSSGLQFARQRGHGIEVTCERHADKTNFHSVFSILVCLVFCGGKFEPDVPTPTALPDRRTSMGKIYSDHSEVLFAVEFPVAGRE